MTKKITIREAPDLSGQPQVDLLKKNFDATIYQKGYNILIEKALKCPCKVPSGGDHLSSCRNCGGSGWFFINPVQTKGIIQSINRNTRYQQWSAESIGNASITINNDDTLAFMDRVTMIDSEIFFSQILFPKQYKEVFFTYTTYDIVEISDVFLFLSDQDSLQLLKKGDDYNFSGNKLIVNDKYSAIANCTVSVRYKHRPQFHVIDLVRELRRSNIISKVSGKQQQISLPISAVIRRAHNVMNQQDYTGDLIFDNSYGGDCKKD